MTPPLVLHRDEHLLVLSKPAGMPVQPDATGDRSLLDVARERVPDACLVHRIDRPVSGAVLFACTAAALDPCHRMFREHAIAKTYWAIVHGALSASCTWEHRLLEDGRARKARVVEGPAGRMVSTQVRPLTMGERYTLVELKPVQGLFHQLRAQCGASGHPIKGDVKYGARRGEKDRSIALHARSLTFVHPFTGSTACIEAPPPEGLLWQRLCGNHVR